MGGGFDLSGKWDGVYAYPAVPGAGPVTPFLAEIVERHGRISGTIIEPHKFHRDTICATLEGVRAETSVDFLKTFQALLWEYDQPVAYVGTVSADGNMISGHWMLRSWSGPFEMIRQLGATIASKAQVEVVTDA